MDNLLQQATALIQNSFLFTKEQKTELLSNLPSLDEEKLKELIEKITTLEEKHRPIHEKYNRLRAKRFARFQQEIKEIAARGLQKMRQTSEKANQKEEEKALAELDKEIDSL